MKRIFGFAGGMLALALLAGCNADQITAAKTDAVALCDGVSLAEAEDPALASHNPKLVAAGAKVCAAVPVVAPMVLTNPPAD